MASSDVDEEQRVMYRREGEGIRATCGMRSGRGWSH